MTFSATYLGSSGWSIKIGNLRILIDPWLSGNLSFSPGTWLIEGKLKSEINIKIRFFIGFVLYLFTLRLQSG